MRKLLAVLIVPVFIYSCKSNNNSTGVAAIQGAYSVASEALKGSSVDTSYTQGKQFFIYTDSFLMYIRVSPGDSTGSFGVGSYIIDSGKIAEHITYNAAGISESTTAYPDTVILSKNAKGNILASQQVSSSMGIIRVTDEYQSVGTVATSAIDGVWKQVEGYTLTGKDTVHWRDVQYKAFYAGMFCYGNFVTTNNTGEHKAFVSYGSFTLSGDTLKENITAANTPGIAGKSFDLNIAMNGKDRFTQTVTINGNKEVIVYERVKK